MKFKKSLLIMPLLLAISSLTGCGGSEEDDFEAEQKEIAAAYYKDLNMNEKGAYFEEALQRHLFAKHKTYVKYSQINSYFSKTSQHNSAENIPGTDKNEFFYSGLEKKSVGTREHVWPCANSDGLWVHEQSAGIHYVDGSKYKGGGSDLYHVRTAMSPVNTLRGNSKFVDFDDDEFKSLVDEGQVHEYNYDGGKYGLKVYGETMQVDSKGVPTGKYGYASKCEPADQMKGDVARIILYLYVHYLDRGCHDSKYDDMVGNLTLTNIFGYSSMERCIYELVEWNELDAPSKVEKQRNATVQKIQGNRNPFVDHPEFARKIFEEDYELPPAK